MEFSTPKSFRKSLQTTFFCYLEKQADKVQNGNFKQVFQDISLCLKLISLRQNN